MCVTQSCATPCDPMDCNPPGSSVHEILQARILEWVAIRFSRESSQPWDQTRVSSVAGGFFIISATRERGLGVRKKHLLRSIVFLLASGTFEVLILGGILLATLT